MKKSAANKNQLKKEDVKQAVIVDYKAIGCESPGNRSDAKPFIQYTLEWLLIEQFEELFICCLPDNADEMKQFVEHFLETQNVPPTMSIQVHCSENNRSTGDCLRNLDAKALIKTDFVIMDVGCCGNLPLAELLEAHKNLKKSDRYVILTSIVRNVFTKNPAEIGEFPIYVTESRTGRLLHYVTGRVTENASDRHVTPTPHFVDVPTSICFDHESVNIHTNLCSTNLSVYSANVPALYTELFDSHSEADLIQAAFRDYEVSGNTIYVHIVDDLFSQRMADFGFAINQRVDQFDTNLIYKRNGRCQVLRKLVNDSLIDCTRLNPQDYLSNLEEDVESECDSSSDSEAESEDGEEAFLRDVIESLVRGFEESLNITNENLVMELNIAKHHYNVSMYDIYSTIAKAILVLPHRLPNGPKSVPEYCHLVESSIERFKDFILNYINKPESRDALLSTMVEVHLAKQIEHLTETVLARVIYKLYEEEIDVLDDDCILKWFHTYDCSDKLQQDLRKAPAFLELIKNLEEEDSE